MSDFFAINRYALIVRPRQALLDWVNAIFPEDPVTLSDHKKHDALNVYLIPQFNAPEEALEWLKEHYEPFLKFELEEWCTDPEEWPRPLNWALFERFLDFTVESMVIDSVDEDYDEEFDADFDEGSWGMN